MKTIKMNMLRERAKPLPAVTEEMINECNIETVELMREYLDTSVNLSPKSRKQYQSGLYQFVYYIHENLNDKPLCSISKRDFRRYMSYLTNRGLSSSSLKFKKSAVSAFCRYIEDVIVEEEADYKTFRNFTTGAAKIANNQVYDKVPVTKQEYDLMIETLLDDKNYMGACWVAVAFNSGARRTGILQFKSEIATYKMNDDLNYVKSHNVREKGEGQDGKVVQYMINKEALKYIRLWLDNRGYEHEYIFTVKHKGEIKRIAEGWANHFCEDVLSDIVGRRINPHLFKASCITYLVTEQGVDLKLVSKHVAHHNDVSTTDKYYLIADELEEMKMIFK